MVGKLVLSAYQSVLLKKETFEVTYSFSMTALDSMKLDLHIKIQISSIHVSSLKYIFYASHFGSHWTYPLLEPFTSLTTNSKVSKSRAVTASNATSNIIRDHSKKAYVVYADN